MSRKSESVLSDELLPVLPFAAGSEDYYVLYDRLPPTDLIEHSHSAIQIGVSFGHNAVEAHWHTATGFNRHQSLRRGEISIIPSNQPHAAAWNQDTPFFTVFLAPHCIFAAVQDETNENSFELIEQFGIRDALIENLIGSLVFYRQQEVPITEFYLDAFNTVLSQHLLACYSTGARKFTAGNRNLPPHLPRAFEFIEDNLEQTLTIKTVARAAAMSEFHFARFFKSASGRTVHGYIVERRLERARLLLENKNISIAEIAVRFGFASPSHFAAAFRRRYSMTPTEYRKFL